MSEFRTHQEMNEVYQERAERGESGQPYVLGYETPEQLLVFFGASHSNDPADNQWQNLGTKWQAFVDHPNQNKVVLYENQSAANAITQSREASLQKYSESGLVAWLADQADTTAESGEPDLVEEVEHLKKSYAIPGIMTYYFGRQMHQWLAQDYRTNPDWQNYGAETVRQYGTLGCWDGEKLELDKVLTWFKEATGKDFDPHDKQTLYALSDPAQSAISSASGRFRDQCLFKKIQANWQQGDDVFIVYGSGHAIVLEPALKELTKVDQA